MKSYDLRFKIKAKYPDELTLADKVPEMHLINDKSEGIQVISIDKNRSSNPSSSEKGISGCSPTRSVVRKKSPSSTHISLARAGSMLVSALIEFKLLNKKCGFSCAFSAFNSASRASIVVSSNRASALIEFSRANTT